MTNILLGIIMMIAGALLTFSFVGILIGIPVFVLGLWTSVRGVFGIFWGAGTLGVSAYQSVSANSGIQGAGGNSAPSTEAALRQRYAPGEGGTEIYKGEEITNSNNWWYVRGKKFLTLGKAKAYVSKNPVQKQ